MRQDQKQQYRLPNQRNRRPGRFLWLLALLAIVAGVWLWWHPGKTIAPASKPKTVFAAPPAPHKAVTPPRTQTTTTNPVPAPTGAFPRTARDVLEAQLALARLGISPGSLDGAMGS